MKNIGKIGMLIGRGIWTLAKLVIVWQAVVPWLDDMFDEIAWMNDELATGIFVFVVTVIGWQCVNTMIDIFRKFVVVCGTNRKETDAD